MENFENFENNEHLENTENLENLELATSEKQVQAHADQHGTALAGRDALVLLPGGDHYSNW